jgi:hypothetical protein
MLLLFFLSVGCTGLLLYLVFIGLVGGWLDKTLPQLPLNREFERRPDLGLLVARDSFKLSLQTSPVYYQFARKK